MEELPGQIGKSEDVECAKCKQLTMHTVLSSYKTSWIHEEDDIAGGATHDFLRCNGCGEGTYRVISWFSEEPGTCTELHPPRGRYHREPKDWRVVSFEGNLPRVYIQTIKAFNANLYTLAGAGVRLLIEGACIGQKVVDGPKFDDDGNPIFSKAGKEVRSDRLDGKINGLVEKKYISFKQASYLHEIRFLGNDAAHQLDIPTAEVLGHAIDIVEHLIDQVYEQPDKARRVAARKRPAK